MPDIGTMHQLNPEPPHIGTMHQLGPEPLHTGEIITPQAQAEEYAREAQESADNAALSAAAAQSAAETAQQAAESIAPALDEKADAIHTAAGPAPIVSIPDAAAAPVDALTVGIEPVQSGSGDPSPENVRPITGWTGANVTRAGSNICPIATLPSAIYWGSDNSDLKAVLNALPVGEYSFYLTYVVDILPGNGKVTHGRPYLTAIVNGSQSPVMSYSVTNDASPSVGKEYRDGGTFTITESIKGNFNHCYLYCDQQDTHTGNERGQYSIKNIQIEVGSTATAYEPYQGSTYDITFPAEAGTVYGGTLDVTNGVLTVDRAMVDLGTLTWTTYSSPDRNVFRSAYPNPRPFIGNSALLPHAICSSYYPMAYNPISAADNGAFSFGNERVVVIDHRFTDASLFSEAVSGVQLVYELATPVTYQLTNQHVIETLKDTNNIWADTGDVTVGYKADTKLYINKKFAELQALILEH